MAADTDPATQVVVEEPVVPEPTAADLAGPWADQIRTRFTDPETQAAVDGFLREQVQPYVTKLEQSTRDIEDAKRLYDDLSSNPGETFLAITEELFGEEASAKVIEALRTGAAAEDAEGNVEPTPGAQLDPETREVLEYAKQRKQQEEYDAALAQFKSKGHEIIDHLFHPFVAAAEGDFEVAYEGYKQFVDDARKQFGEAPAPTSEAPPVIASDTGTPPAVPTEKKYASIDDAIDDFFTEQKAQAPPVVGSV